MCRSFRFADERGRAEGVDFGAEAQEEATAGLDDGVGEAAQAAGEGGGGFLAEDAGFQDVALERGEARVAAELLEGGLVGDEAELRVEPFVEGPVVRGIGRVPVDGDGDLEAVGAEGAAAVAGHAMDDLAEVGAEEAAGGVVRVVAQDADEAHEDVLHAFVECVAA